MVKVCPMEGSLGLKYMNIKNQIINHCGQKPKLESCGFVVFEDGQLKIQPMDNMAEDPEKNFYIGAKDFLFAKNNYEIIAVYHSHPEGDENPSVYDKNSAEASCYPFVIFCLSNRKFGVYEPEFMDCDSEKYHLLKEELND